MLDPEQTRSWIGSLSRVVAPLAVLISLSATTTVRAVTLSPIGDFEQPTYVTSEPDPDRLLVTERLGKIELVDEGQVSLFSDLTSLIGCPPEDGCDGERGLMSVAVAPDFASSGHIYVFYADNSSGEIHVDQLTATGGSAPLSTRLPVLTIAHSEAANHNGGQLQFGPDGYLYVSTGDGGGGGDEFHHSQDLNSLLGKLLRIDPHPTVGGGTYLVPAGNPFPTATAPFNTIWSYGLRNPFRFSFDSLSGDLVIGDVGQGAREEIDFAPRLEGGGVGGGGANWGWNCREGFFAGPADDLPPGECASIFAASGFAGPVFDYPHTDPHDGSAHGCAIIGGYVARDPGLGDLEGRYVYTDLCAGDIRSLELPASGSGLATGDRSEGVTVSSPVSFGEDSCNRLYVVEGGGEVSRLEGDAPAICSPKGPPPGGGGNEPGEDPGKQLPPTPPPKKRTHAHLSASKGASPSSKAMTASLEGRVTPCAGRTGKEVTLNRGGRRSGVGELDGNCAVVFRRVVRHRATFRLLVPASGDYAAARSRPVTIDPRGRASWR